MPWHVLSSRWQQNGSPPLAPAGLAGLDVSSVDVEVTPPADVDDVPALIRKYLRTLPLQRVSRWRVSVQAAQAGLWRSIFVTGRSATAYTSTHPSPQAAVLCVVSLWIRCSKGSVWMCGAGGRVHPGPPYARQHRGQARMGQAGHGSHRTPRRKGQQTHGFLWKLE